MCGNNNENAIKTDMSKNAQGTNFNWKKAVISLIKSFDLVNH